jgi:nucleoside-diphosphate-sugar epimerase
MTRALIIGGKGKVGGYLVPMLVAEGYEVINVSRGITEPYIKSEEWNQVKQLTIDRSMEGFEEQIVAQNPDIVVDMICFKNEDMIRLINSLRNHISHYLVCGSVWMHGHSASIPVLEEESRNPLEEYGIQKNMMDRTISEEFSKHSFPGTIIHPGHIVCPGDIPINPQGCKNLTAFTILKSGEALFLPNFGMETVHHVHAKDVASLFLAAIKAGKPSFGQGFHSVSPRAVSLRGYAEEVASWYGQVANLVFEPFDTWKNRVSEKDAQMTLSHILHSPSASMEKAKRLLGYDPKYTSFEAIKDCLASFKLI